MGIELCKHDAVALPDDAGSDAPACSSAANNRDQHGATAKSAKNTCTSWTDGSIGIFGLEIGQHRSTYIEAVGRTDLLLLGLKKWDRAGTRSYFVDDHEVSIGGPEATVVYLPEGCHMALRDRMSTGYSQHTTLIIRPERLSDLTGMQLSELPLSMQGMFGRHSGFVQRRFASLALQRIGLQVFEHDAGDRYFNVFMRCKAYEFLWAFLSFLSEKDGSEDQGKYTITGRDYRSVARAKELIERNLRQSHSVDELAKLVGRNRTSLRHAFRQVCGETISDFRTRLRMAAAVRLLRETDREIENISLELGYRNISSFFVAFKKFYGQTPGRVRDAQ